MNKIAQGFLLLLFTISITSCTDNSKAQADVESQPVQTSEPQLKEIMQGLEEDLAMAAHGIWVQDPQIVQGAAIRIADHPKVTQEQLAVIKLGLGDEIGDFVRLDQAVHSAAVELTESAGASGTMEELLVIYHRIEVGCMTCHSAFQKRVSDALATSGNS